MLVTTAMVAGRRRKRAVALVGLHHHPVAGAQPRVGAVGVDDAAVDHGRIEAARPPARRRSATVVVVLPCVPPTAIDHLQPHQLGQHLGAAHHRHAGARARPAPRDCPSSPPTRRPRPGRRRGCRRAWPIATGMPMSRSRRDVGAVGDVAALHLVAEIVQHLGDAATCRCRRCRRNGSVRYRAAAPSCGASRRRKGAAGRARRPGRQAARRRRAGPPRARRRPCGQPLRRRRAGPPDARPASRR